MEGGAVGHNFERDPPRDHPCQVRFNLAQRFQRIRFKCESLRRTTDAKWWQKLTWPSARWAKNVHFIHKCWYWNYMYRFLWYGGNITGNEREEYGNYWLNRWQYCSTLMPPLILGDNTRSQAYSVNFRFYL